jgi:hypothetical protein
VQRRGYSVKEYKVNRGRGREIHISKIDAYPYPISNVNPTPGARICSAVGQLLHFGRGQMRGESSGGGSGGVGSDELRTGETCMRRDGREKSVIRRKGWWGIGRSMIGKVGLCDVVVEWHY